MTAVQTIPTETELAEWLTRTIGDTVTDDYQAARTLLTAFDLLDTTANSLNNVHHIAACIDTLRSDSGQPWTRLAAPPAVVAGKLCGQYRITRKPDDHARILINLPTPMIVSRHQCPFCRRFTRADAKQVTDHMTRCWQNPSLRCCKTCTHHQDASGTPGSPDEWLESCTHDAGPEDYSFPVLHCPLWQPKEH